jgi:rhamnose transport system ATP-binding protein
LTPPLLQALSIEKSFAGIRALAGVSFDVGPGEVHALVGENGAGKSSLVKILTGALTPDAGDVFINGQPVERFDPAAAQALGIAAIYQQPPLFPDLTVAENIALGSGGLAPWRRVDWKMLARRATELVERVGAPIDPRRSAGTLSMAEQQIVAIATALGANARVLIMDEPTASLSDREVRQLFSIIDQLRAHAVGIIYISHRLDEVFAIADRVTVLRDGHAVATRMSNEFTRDHLIQLMVGREVDLSCPERRAAAGAIALELQGVSSVSAAVSDISLSVKRGEILGLAGLVGAGRTELAEALFGLRRIDSGRVLVDGTPSRIESPEDAIRLGITYVPEDRARHGVIGALSVSQNTSLATLPLVSRRGLVQESLEQRSAEMYVKQLGIRTPSVLALVSSLSGGNQQKVALARWLAARPRVLILDEPTQGVDVAAKAEIHSIIGQLADEGAAVILISSDLSEILAMSDRIIVLCGGRITGELSRAKATPQAVLALAIHERQAAGRA